MKQILAICALVFLAVGLVADECMWSGFYGGAHFGIAKDSDPGWTYTAAGGTATVDEIQDDAFGGVQLGYNWQMERLVLGIEGDFSFTKIRGSGICPNPSWDCDVELRETSSLRVRLGLSLGRFLPYVTAGYAMTEAEIYDHNALSGTFGEESNMYGPVYGGGVSYAVTDNLSLFVEYLYYAFNEESMVVDNNLVVVVDTTLTVFRAGINYRFW